MDSVVFDSLNLIAWVYAIYIKSPVCYKEIYNLGTSCLCERNQAAFFYQLMLNIVYLI